MGPVAPDMNQADAALVISPWLEGWFLPALFAAAGMPCDLVSACPVFHQSQRLRRLDLVSSAADLAPRALHLWRQHGPYAWVIACSDALLGELAQRALLDSAYRSLLPLTPLASTAHLHAKIGLSRAFTAAGIPTPAWRVARDPASALQQAPALGWPLLLKQDASAGGRGLWLCQNPEELSQAVQIQAGRPFLLQQWRDGRLYSVEALYRQGTLQAFALSEMLAGVGRYGPSTQRCYGLSVDRIPELEVHLERIGTALGLHGFTNISLIHAGGAEPAQFIECDVRPNAWIHLDRALGGDFARALRLRPTATRHQLRKQRSRLQWRQPSASQPPRRVAPATSLERRGSSPPSTSRSWAAFHGHPVLRARPAKHGPIPRLTMPPLFWPPCWPVGSWTASPVCSRTPERSCRMQAWE
jgi:hypothetical protein